MATKRAAGSCLAVTLLLLPGCYLGHVASGQARLLLARQPIERVVADPATPTAVRDRLTRVRAVREFAERLGLSVRDRYQHYAPWPGDRIVTTVVATRPGELEPAGFWFPIVGRVPYKGYFDPARAEHEAERLRGDGLDVCEVAVPAYSTLGWFDDPVTEPMLRLPENQLVETLIHELVHATAFASGQAEFNEGVASFVGEEGRVRFYAAESGPDAAAREREAVSLRRRQRDELLRLRGGVQALYAGESDTAERARRRAALERDARDRVAALMPAEARAADLASRLRLNDACLALAATYAADTACYADALDALGGDLARFVARVRDAAQAPDPRAAVLDGARCPGAPEASASR
jgi:predicted aminopeptidase